LVVSNYPADQASLRILSVAFKTVSPFARTVTLAGCKAGRPFCPSWAGI